VDGGERERGWTYNTSKAWWSNRDVADYGMWRSGLEIWLSWDGIGRGSEEGYVRDGEKKRELGGLATPTAVGPLDMALAIKVRSSRDTLTQQYTKMSNPSLTSLSPMVGCPSPHSRSLVPPQAFTYYLNVDTNGRKLGRRRGQRP